MTVVEAAAIAQAVSDLDAQVQRRLGAIENSLALALRDKLDKSDYDQDILVMEARIAAVGTESKKAVEVAEKRVPMWVTWLIAGVTAILVAQSGVIVTLLVELSRR